MSAKSPVIRSLHLRNYRSIRDETLYFDNPLFLVGRNGSGKSNVVDALAFLADCMRLPFPSALSLRHGIIHVSATPENPSVLLKVTFNEGHYTLQFRYLQDQGMVIEEEVGQWGNESFRRVGERIESSIPGITLRVTPQGIALPLLGGVEAFSELFLAISKISIHHVNYQAIRIAEVTGGSQSKLLEKSGANLGAVLLGLPSTTRDQINLWLKRLVGMDDVSAYPSKEGSILLGFGQQWNESGMGHSIGWISASVSDGTLNAAGLIVALLQEPAPSLVIIEEPETNLHPGVLNVVSDLILAASERTQVVVTTHSPDLLDAKWICPENLRIVSWEQGATRVRPLGEVPQGALREHLMYAGQLLRANALDAAP